MSEFRFENTFRMTEAQHVALLSVSLPRSRSGLIKLIIAASVGVLFLFTPYTLILGVVLLVLVMMAIFLPELTSLGARQTFHQQKYLREAITYGVSDQRLWVKSAHIEASASWSMLVTWREVEDWFVLSPSGIPPVLLSLARLKEEGLYGRVRALAASNAPKYGTPTQ